MEKQTEKETVVRVRKSDRVIHEAWQTGQDKETTFQYRKMWRDEQGQEWWQTFTAVDLASDASKSSGLRHKQFKVSSKSQAVAK